MQDTNSIHNMGFRKHLKKAASAVVSSPIQIDFAKGGGRTIQQVAPYPKEVFWDSTVPIYTLSLIHISEPTRPY